MKRHRLDPFSLLFGVLFTVAGLLYLSGESNVASLPRPGWLLPVSAMAVGAVIVATVVRERVEESRARRTAPLPSGNAEVDPDER